jgi:type IV pilus assembly protein PilA
MTRRPLTDDHGFTLVEILVVVLMVSILILIALPSFIGQRTKGHDVEAQATIRTAQMALRTYETDHDTFNATRAQLEAIEPAIRDATGDFDVSGTATTYEITEHSDSGTDFTLERDGSGVITRSCSAHGRGLCKANPDADGNRW